MGLIQQLGREEGRPRFRTREWGRVRTLSTQRLRTARRQVVGSGGRSLPLGHSPHPAVSFAVGRVYADGPLAVLHSPSVVPQFAVGRGSGDTKQGGACSLPRRSLLGRRLGRPVCRVGVEGVGHRAAQGFRPWSTCAGGCASLRGKLRLEAELLGSTML